MGHFVWTNVFDWNISRLICSLWDDCDTQGVPICGPFLWPAVTTIPKYYWENRPLRVQIEKFSTKFEHVHWLAVFSSLSHSLWSKVRGTRNLGSKIASFGFCGDSKVENSCSVASQWFRIRELVLPSCTYLVPFDLHTPQLNCLKNLIFYLSQKLRTKEFAD